MQKMKWQNRRFRIHSLVLFTFPPSDAAKMGPNGFDSPCEHRNSKVPFLCFSGCLFIYSFLAFSSSALGRPQEESVC